VLTASANGTIPQCGFSRPSDSRVRERARELDALARTDPNATGAAVLPKRAAALQQAPGSFLDRPSDQRSQK
jgi:hypothetical protein